MHLVEIAFYVCLILVLIPIGVYALAIAVVVTAWILVIMGGIIGMIFKLWWYLVALTVMLWSIIELTS